MTTVHYEISPEEEARLAGDLWLASKSMAATRRTSRAAMRIIAGLSVLVALPMVVGGLRLFVLGERGYADYLLATVLVIAYLVSRGFTKRVLENSARNMFKSMAQYDPDWTVVVPHSITLTPQAMRHRTTRAETNYSWTRVVDVSLSTEAVGLVLPGAVISVPNRAFADDDSRDRFVAEANSCRSEAGDAAANNLNAYLSDRDAKCVRCNYILRGLESPRCPECGWEIDLLELQWKAISAPE